MTSLNILLADDDSLIRGVMAEEIEEAGHRVRPVRSGADALAALSDEHFDILLLDYAMPGMMGTEAARLARAANPLLPIAILTGYGDLLDDVTGRSCAFPVIPKGRMDVILRAILAIAGGQELPPVSAPESRWEAIQQRMAATSSSQYVGQTLRALYSEPLDMPIPEEFEALLPHPDTAEKPDDKIPE